MEINLRIEKKDEPQLPRGVRLIELNRRLIFAQYYAGTWVPLPDDEALELARKMKMV
jgi:hypothetical protein